MNERIDVVAQYNVIPSGDGGFLVQVWDEAGREYTRCHEFKYSSVAARFGDRVADAMSIDPNLWACRVPYGTQAWIDDDMEWTLMDDEELYHRRRYI